MLQIKTRGEKTSNQPRIISVHYHRCHNNSFSRTSVSQTKSQITGISFLYGHNARGLICQHHCPHWCNASHFPSQVGPMNCLTVSRVHHDILSTPALAYLQATANESTSKNKLCTNMHMDAKYRQHIETAPARGNLGFQHD